MPRSAASSVARRRALRRSDRRLAIPGRSSSRTVAPWGRMPSASPGSGDEPWWPGSAGGRDEEGSPVAGEEAWHPGSPTASETTSRSAATRLVTGARFADRAGRRDIMPRAKAASCCPPVCGFQYAGDTPRLSTMRRMRVLIVEDEPLMAEAVRRGLRLEAIAADIAGDGTAALELLSVNSYDIAVLDRDIPAPSGDEVARHIVSS